MWSRFVMSQVKHNSYFLCGMALGLWVSLTLVPLDEETAGCVLASGGAAGAGGAADEYSPAREERPLGPAGQAAGRSVQRPRYYSTELGMRGSLLTGVLSSERALAGRAAALNRTLARLQPALKFFITASTITSAPGLANVVGFTDTREMLKPFHALKYLADNYLEEYDFFFLVSDSAFVNTARLTELVSKLSVSQDVYMGTVAEDDSHYCSLESGIIISNSVLRSVHGELDWCVRNSYSPHHHENLGRCILHAAHRACTQDHQGVHYSSVSLAGGPAAAAAAALADAVTAHPAEPDDMYRLHAYVSRVRLERLRLVSLSLRAELGALRARLPAHARNASWPAGLRADPTLAPPAPLSRFEHLRWTLFNASHAFMPDEHRAAAELVAPTKDAVELVVRETLAWARRRWAWSAAAELAEGAWQWAPPHALRYRLLLRLTTPAGAQVLRGVEAARALGAARLAPARYVTESARVRLLLLVPLQQAGAARAAAALLQRHRLLRDSNTHVYVVTFPPEGMNSSTAEEMTAELRGAVRGQGEVVSGGVLPAGLGGEAGLYARAGRAALRAVAGRAGEDALLLLLPPHLEYNQDFLNRVRMNTVRGAQWFSALPFSRHAHSAHSAHSAAHAHSGRFNQHAYLVSSFYKDDYDKAEAAWRGSEWGGVPAVLGAAPALRVLRAPEPGALLPARPAPCARAPPTAPPTCQRALDLRALDLGPRAALAQLLLQTQHDQL